MDKEIPKIYKELAERNDWNISFSGSRLYFMKDGKYATPDENVTEEDKILLANYISEGSSKMEELILNCWSNNLRITGPCSGILEFHEEQPMGVHFGIVGPKEILETLCKSLQEIFPNFSNMLREEKNNEFRYDFNYFFKDKEGINKQESDSIFSTINEELNKIIENNLNKSKKH